MRPARPGLLSFSLLIGAVFVASALAAPSLPPASETGPPPLTYLPLVVREVAPVTFTHGIASGDVTSSTAQLWTRLNHEAPLTLQVSQDPSFLTAVNFPNLLAPAGSDFTLQHEVEGLDAGQTYYYRWISGGVASPSGVFRTAPAPAALADLRLTFSGDADGTTPFWGDFSALKAARLENSDFFVFLGDTVYSDSSLRPGGPAITLREYRDTYLKNLENTNLKDLLAASSTYAIWDDHEVINDWSGQNVDPTRFANGRQAFLEYMPIDEGQFPADPGCAADPLFRTFNWGAAADIVVLDERSCRSPKAEGACTGPLGLDPAPTAPQDLRTQFGFPIPPPAGCLAAINDPARTVLGDVQKQLFKDFLLNSTAKYKLVINQVHIMQLYVYPYDRWEGFGAERLEILNFIRDNAIEGVIFLTTDLHANLMNEVFIDETTDPETIAYEFVTGPVASLTLEQAIFNVLGQNGVDAVHNGLDSVGMDCRHLDAYSYGLVEIDASAGTATITLKDENGAALEDQANPGTFCTLTLGP